MKVGNGICGVTKTMSLFVLKLVCMSPLTILMAYIVRFRRLPDSDCFLVAIDVGYYHTILSSKVFAQKFRETNEMDRKN